MDEQTATFLGVSSHTSAESQEDAACVGEMQNQHLGRVFLERGTMKLIFEKNTQQYFFSMTEKGLSILFFLLIYSCRVSVALPLGLLWI